MTKKLTSNKQGSLTANTRARTGKKLSRRTASSSAPQGTARKSASGSASQSASEPASKSATARKRQGKPASNQSAGGNTLSRKKSSGKRVTAGASAGKKGSRRRKKTPQALPSDPERWQPGKLNLITDVPGLSVGNAGSKSIKSGVTVLSAEQPFVASVDVMGGAPGTRETDCLDPDKVVHDVDALVLSGGSAFGLDAASGVADALREAGRGFPVGPVRVPIVPAAIIFDLLNGGASDWQRNPYRAMGRRAYANRDRHFDLGSQGAGTGATTATLKGGLGSASLVLPNGIVVGALVAVNPHGSVVVPGSRQFWAAPFELNNEYGGRGITTPVDPHALPRNEKLRALERLHQADGKAPASAQGMNTTIAIVATNAALSKAQLKRIAVAAQDGMARAIVPSHTPFDGDLIFALSTSEETVNNPLEASMTIGHAAAVCLARAIARGVYHASAAPRDILPVWSSPVED